MRLTPKSARARNRLKEHDLEFIRLGICQGKRAILTRCVEEWCDWKGWFTDDDADWELPRKNEEGA